MENQFIYHSPFGDRPIKLAVSSYNANPLSLAITFTSLEDGLPFGTGTVNIGSYTGNASLLGPYCAYVDTNNLPDIEAFLKENHLAEPYIRFGEQVYGFSGFCSYPLYQFERDLLMDLDPEGTAAYEKDYIQAFIEEQEKMNRAMYGLDYDWSSEPEIEAEEEPMNEAEEDLEL